MTLVTPLEAALSYAQLGWPVVPLHTPITGVCDCPKRADCPKPGKHPRTVKGVDAATTDMDRIRLWWGKMWPHANIGLALLPAELVDIAPDSIEWQAEFIARGLPPTTCFRSGGGDGHEHHLYRKPDDCPPTKINRSGEFDIMVNAYAVVPPSMHESGRRYEWVNTPEEVPLAPCPVWAVDMLREVGHRQAVATAPGTDDPDEPPVQLSGEALERWHGAIVALKPDGRVDRSSSLVQIANALSAAGATKSTIRQALQNRDEALGWSKYVGRRDATRRYDIIAHTALNGRASPRLVIPPTNGHVVAEIETPPLQERRFKLLTAAELKNRPDPEWQVEGVVQRDTLMLIVGAQETYKTFVALDMALSISEGQDWHERPCKQGTTVYVSAEGGSGLGLRVHAWEIARGVESKAAFFLADQAPQFLDRNRGGDVEELLLSLALLEHKPTFIVVDTLARVMVGHDENSAEDMGVLIATADRIRQATGATVALVHHNNKQGGARGSTALLGAVHTIIECSRETNSPRVVVKCGKQKDADHFQSMILEARTIALDINETSGQSRTSLVLNAIDGSIFGQAARVELTAVESKALAALDELGTAGYAAWRDASKLAETTFKRTRRDLINNGYVDHLQDGNYHTSDLYSPEGPRGAKQGPWPLGPRGQMGGQKGPYVVEGPLAPWPGPSPDPEEGPEKPWI